MAIPRQKPRNTGKILAKAKAIGKFLEDLSAYATERVLGGENLPGFKVVEATKRKAWRSEDIALGWIRDNLPELSEADYTTMKLITPTQMMNLLKKELRLPAKAQMVEDAALVYTPQGEPVLAPVTDKRPEFKPVDVKKEFSDVEE